MNVTSSLASIQAAIPIETNLSLGQFTIETAKTSGFLDQELVTKAYVDNAGSGSQLTLT